MRKTFTLLFLVLSVLMAKADAEQTVTIDGTVVKKTVTRITFDGDNVRMTFADNSQQTVDMEAVNIRFTYTSGVQDIQINEKEAPKVFNLNGHYLGNGLEGRSKGVYIVGGKKVIIK